MERRAFLTKGAAGVLTFGVMGCSNDKSPFSAGEKAVVSGMIADAEGNAVQGAVVALSGPEPAKTAYTNSAGKYMFEVAKNGEYTLNAVKAGYKFSPASQKIVISGMKSLIVNIMAIITNTSKSGLPKTQLGNTGISVSKFGFGSHIINATVRNNKELREYMIRQALDYGMTLFDVYNTESSQMQYEPMGKYLAPSINDVTISIAFEGPDSGRTVEQEIDYDLQLFGKSRIDLVRHRGWTKGDSSWYIWEELFKLRDKGKIGAVGLVIHAMGEGTAVDTQGNAIPSDFNDVFSAYPDDLNYVIFPYNFYHNIGWPPSLRPEFPNLAETLRAKGIGIITMKPFAGEYCVPSFTQTAKTLNPNVPFGPAALKYIINSGLNPDATIAGMNYLDELNANVDAYLNPGMSADDTAQLDGIRDSNVVVSKIHVSLPEHYKFLNDWAPKRETKLV